MRDDVNTDDDQVVSSILCKIRLLRLTKENVILILCKYFKRTHFINWCADNFSFVFSLGRK